MIKNKSKLKYILLSIIGFVLLMPNVNAITYNPAGPKYQVYREQNVQGIIGYCIDPHMAGGINAAVLKGGHEELTGAILSWAQGFASDPGTTNGALKQQIAYRLIAARNGMAHEDNATLTNMLAGYYTGTPEFVEVYNSWQQQQNQTVNRNGSSSAFMELVSNTKTATSFTAVISVDAGSETLYIKTDKPGITITPNVVTGNDQQVVVSGPLNSECTGEDLVVYATKNTTTTTTETSTNTKCVNNTVTWHFYDMKEYQSFIVPVPENRNVPGCDISTTSSTSEKSKVTPQNVGTVEIDIDPDDCNSDCKATYDGDFACEEGKTTNEWKLHETQNIKACIIKSNGKYDGAGKCGSIKKKTNLPKTLDTIVNQKSLELDDTYCSVYCVENVDYYLPGKIKVKNGSYFKLLDGEQRKDITLKGTRRCYTSNIDNKKYASAMRGQQRKVVKAYNEYLKWKAYAEKYESLSNFKKEDNTSCTVQTCSATAIKDAKGKTIGYSYSASDTASSTKSYKYTADVKYIQYRCTFDPNSGEATSCSVENKSDPVTEKDTVDGETKSTCADGTTQYVSACGTVTTYKPEAKHAMYLGKSQSALRDAQKASKELDTIVGKYKSCFYWTNNYCFNPKIKFSYEDGEQLYTDVNNQYLTGNSEKAKQNKTGDVSEVQGESKQYFSSVNMQYEGTDLGKTAETNKYYVYIDSEEFTRKPALVDTTTHYISSTISKQSVFNKSSVKVYTYHPYGTIVTGDSYASDGKNYVLLGDDGYVFPVSLQKKEKRQYNYYLNFENVGVDGNDGASCDSDAAKNFQTNRLMGCSAGEDIYTKSSTKTEDKYTCQYGSCPECKVDCKCPDGSKNCIVENHICKYITCDTCKIRCAGCIWNSGDTAFKYKQVSLTNIFPESKDKKDLGYNWNTDPEVNPQAEKAEATIKEIEKKNETVYDSKPQYRAILTPNVTSLIRTYNDIASGSSKGHNSYWGDIEIGGYNNVTLICVQGIQCKSSFLNVLESKKVLTIRNRDNNNKDIGWKTYNDGSAWK